MEASQGLNQSGREKQDVDESTVSSWNKGRLCKRENPE